MVDFLAYFVSWPMWNNVRLYLDAYILFESLFLPFLGCHTINTVKWCEGTGVSALLSLASQAIPKLRIKGQKHPWEVISENQVSKYIKMFFLGTKIEVLHVSPMCHWLNSSKKKRRQKFGLKPSTLSGGPSLLSHSLHLHFQEMSTWV